MDKKTITALIDRLGGYDSDLDSFADYLQSRVLLGDVMQKLHDYAFTCGIPGKNLYSLELRGVIMDLWLPCGLKRSLQEIFDCGYEEVINETPCAARVSGTFRSTTEQLKDPNARNLAEKLLALFPTSPK